MQTFPREIGFNNVSFNDELYIINIDHAIISQQPERVIFTIFRIFLKHNPSKNLISKRTRAQTTVGSVDKERDRRVEPDEVGGPSQSKTIHPDNIEGKRRREFRDKITSGPGSRDGEAISRGSGMEISGRGNRRG